MSDREEILNDLLSRKRKKRRNALDALRSGGFSTEERLALLAQAASSENEDARTTAAVGLGQLASPEAYEVLMEMARRGSAEDEFVRREAVLAAMDNESVRIEDLEVLYESETSSAVREELDLAITRISGTPTHWICPECGYAVEIDDANRQTVLYRSDRELLADPAPSAMQMVARRATSSESRWFQLTGRLR